MRPRRPAADPESPKAAYLAALRWLGARELSEAQVRARLVERGFTPAAIRDAVTRLLDDRTIDDRRTAEAVARREAEVKRHGPRRVMGKLMQMGIDREMAAEVAGRLFGDLSEASLAEASLEKRLRGRVDRLGDPAERRRLVAQLVRQGFTASAAAAAIRSRTRR